MPRPTFARQDSEEWANSLEKRVDVIVHEGGSTKTVKVGVSDSILDTLGGKDKNVFLNGKKIVKGEIFNDYNEGGDDLTFEVKKKGFFWGGKTRRKRSNRRRTRRR